MNPLPAITKLALSRLRWVFATGDQRDAEILALRHQILVLQRQINRPTFFDADRTILALLSSVFDRLRRAEVFLIVRPATVIAWHRQLVAQHWTQPPTAKRGRPPIDPELRRLIIQLAGENPGWGYRRIHGELKRLGHTIAASTVWKILLAAGIDPTRDRTGPTWMQFIRSQATGIIATDFACVDTALLRRFPAEYAIATEQHSKTIYVRESSIVPSLDSWIATLFDDEHIDDTCNSVAQMSDLVPDDRERQAKVRAQINDCDNKLAKYRALLEREGDLDVVGAWIPEVTRERSRLERDIGRKPTGHQFTAVEIKAMVRQLKNIVDALHNAGPEAKRAVYDELGVKLTYFSDGRVHVGAGAPLASPGERNGPAGSRVLVVRVGGASVTLSTRDPWETWLVAA